MTDSPLAPLVGPVAAPELHVMSYNIRRRMPHVIPGSPDRWVHREPLLKRFLTDELPSLVGVQEALPEQANFVRHALGERYRSIGHGREKNGRGEGCPIFYDRERLRLLDWQQTALSDTPEIQGSSTWGNRTPRVVVDATFTDIATGVQFHAVNTHFDNRSRNARLKAATALRRIVLASGLPAIVTGDFNTDAGTEPHSVLLGTGTPTFGALTDAWDAADTRLTDEWGTFLDYRQPRHDHKRIDWILVAKAHVLSAGINTTRFEGGWPSDHAAVQAVVRFGAQGSRNPGLA
jgi:endonuclease/exonuclease/phosphatase family metal-dependent hydrolase